MNHCLFTNNKYTKWYFCIINSSHLDDDKVYKETHHIIPRKLGGTNDISNLVKLTARKHFICHRLLPKMLNEQHQRSSMIYALHMMSNSSKYTCSGRSYARIKEQYIDIHKTRLASLSIEQKQKFAKNRSGKIQSIEERLKRSKSLIGRVISDDHRQKISAANKGRSLTDEHKQKLSISRPGWKMTEESKIKISSALKGKIVSDETRQKMSAAKRGKVVSDETRQKMSDAKKGIKQSEETKKKKSDSAKLRYASDLELKKKIGLAVSLAKKGKPSSMKGKTLTQETKKKMSEARKEFWRKRKADSTKTL